MKAAVYNKYGPPEVLEIKEVETPEPKENEIRIRIHASTVTAGDCELRRMDFPWYFVFLIRLAFGVFKPRKDKILGQEFAGVVDTVGSAVKKFKVGDKVWGSNGMKMGGYGEFVALNENKSLAPVPSNMNFAEACGICVGGSNSLHFLRLAKVKPGEKVLIYGATGSIGLFAVQLAKHYGAEVNAVCNTVDFDLVKSLGAQICIDYNHENYWDREERYDVVFDAIGKSNFSGSLKVLNKGGRFIQANPLHLRHVLAGFFINWFTSKRVIMKLADESLEDYLELNQLIEAGHLKAVIDRHYKLEDIIEAHRYIEKGFKTGNVIIDMTETS